LEYQNDDEPDVRVFVVSASGVEHFCIYCKVCPRFSSFGPMPRP